MNEDERSGALLPRSSVFILTPDSCLLTSVSKKRDEILHSGICRRQTCYTVP